MPRSGALLNTPRLPRRRTARRCCPLSGLLQQPYHNKLFGVWLDWLVLLILSVVLDHILVLNGSSVFYQFVYLLFHQQYIISTCQTWFACTVCFPQHQDMITSPFPILFVFVHLIPILMDCPCQNSIQEHLLIINKKIKNAQSRPTTQQSRHYHQSWYHFW